MQRMTTGEGEGTGVMRAGWPYWIAGAGLVLTLVMDAPAGLSVGAWRTTGMLWLMGTLWMTEVLPLAVTALLPALAFPLLGIAKLEAATAPYADPVIFLFLGGFLLGIAFEHWQLPALVARAALERLGERPRQVIAVLLGVTAFLSCWVSNTTTTVAMLPVALAVVDHAGAKLDPRVASSFKRAALLAVMYGATIGGLGTLIGTPPNALLAAYVRRTYGTEIGFARWMLVGMPLVFAYCAIAWFLLVRRFEAGSLRATAIGAAPATALTTTPMPPTTMVNGTQWPAPPTPALLASASLDPAQSTSTPGLATWGAPQRRVAAVFGLAVVAWITRPWLATLLPGLADTTVALIAASALFLIPAGAGHRRPLADWSMAKQVPWEVLILFGGGLSLAAAVEETGLARWLAQTLEQRAHLPVALLLVLLIVVVVLATEIASNTATAATFLPIASALATSAGIEPMILLVPVALAASTGFMLPVGTPANAIIFGTGVFTVRDMVRAGYWLDLVALPLLMLAAWLASVLFAAG